MSIPAFLFGAYLGIGLVLMVVTVAIPSKEERAKRCGSAEGGTELDFALLLFIALLWPIWIVSLLSKKEPPAK